MVGEVNCCIPSVHTVTFTEKIVLNAKMQQKI